MKATIRGSKGLLALAALAGLGLVLRWITAGSVASASAQDLISMAFLTVGTVAWIAYAWLVLAVLATVLEQTPGAIGRAATLIAAGITSRGSRALLRSALGVAAVTPLTIGVAHANTTTATTAGVDLAPRSDRQLTTGFSRPATAEHPTADIRRTGESSASVWRTTERPSSVRLTETTSSRAESLGKQNPSKRTSRPQHATGKRPEKRLVVPDRPTVGAPTRYTDLRSGQPVPATSRAVKPGDSLWSIAAAELGPEATAAEVAARWPHWYAANLNAIGPNPSLIQPGQVLQPPGPDHPVPPTH